MKWWKIFLPFFFLMIASCNNFSVSSSEDTTLEENTSYRDSKPKEFAKDEEGYYVLPSSVLSPGTKEEGKKETRIAVVDAEESAAFDEYRVYLNEKKVTPRKVKIDTSHTFRDYGNQREDSAVLSFQMEGYVKVIIQLKHPIYRTPVLRPLASSISLSVDKDYRTVSFLVCQKGQYTLEFNDYMTKTLHLFIDDFPLEEKDYSKDSSVLYFGKGIHDAKNDARIGNDNIIRLNQSKKTVYLEQGAVVRASFFAYSLTGVKILGHGIVDGSVFVRNATTGERQIPVDFQFCKDVLIQDVLFLDPAGWCLNLYFLDGALIDNVKIITSRANGDGISLQSCQNVEVKNSFVRTFDDTLVVKNYPKYGDYSIEGTTEHIHFHDCILITDLAQSMEIGYETIGEKMEDITFENITVLHAYHHAVFSIHNGNNAVIKKVIYKNITVEDCHVGEGDGNGKLLDFSVKHSSIWSDNWKTTALGSITGVTMDNIKVDGKNGKLCLEGSLDERDKTSHYLSDVDIRDFSLNGTCLTSSSFEKDSYVSSLSVSSTGKEITGARYVSSSLSEVQKYYSSFVDFL